MPYFDPLEAFPGSPAYLLWSARGQRARQQWTESTRLGFTFWTDQSTRYSSQAFYDMHDTPGTRIAIAKQRPHEEAITKETQGMTRKDFAALTLVACLSVTGARAAGHHPTDKDGEAAEKIIPQTTCPIMGGKINPELYVDADGKRIYVCCPGCIKALKEDPAAAVKKLEDKGVTVARIQTICPITGTKINKKLSVDIEGKRIYVCCPGCIAVVKRDAGAIIKNCQEENIVLEDTPKA